MLYSFKNMVVILKIYIRTTKLVCTALKSPFYCFSFVERKNPAPQIPPKNLHNPLETNLKKILTLTLKYFSTMIVENDFEHSLLCLLCNSLLSFGVFCIPAIFNIFNAFFLFFLVFCGSNHEELKTKAKRQRKKDMRREKERERNTIWH